MSFPLCANIVTTILCLAVLVQSVRMMRSLKAVSNDQIGTVVTALDESTTQARVVLSSLKHTLEGDFAGSVKLVLESREIRDELKMLIEIANSMAERLCESRSPIAAPEPEPMVAAPAQRLADVEPEREPVQIEAQVQAEPPVSAPARAPWIAEPAARPVSKPMDKDDIAASLAELRAVLSRPFIRKDDLRAEAA